MDDFRVRLSEVDLVDRLALPVPAIVVQSAIGVAFFVGALVTRAAVDVLATSAGPFSLIYPAVMLATLYGRWQAGLITWLISYLHAWYVVLPVRNSFEFADPSDFARTLVNGAASLVILFFAEAFRRAVRRATEERDAEIQTRDMLLGELDHRTKNNFAMVASLLDLQRRATTSEEVSEALTLASIRVQSFAAIHASIYSKGAFSDEIELNDYLGLLGQELSAAFFPDDRIQIEVACDPVKVPRDRAVALGLIVNEAVTNAAKHAFAEDASGKISVKFQSPRGAPWVLTVEDDGQGTNVKKPAVPASKGGLGSRLIAAFAQKAGGTLETVSSGDGTVVRLTGTA